MLPDDLRDPRIAERAEPPRAARGVVGFSTRDVVQQRGCVQRVRVERRALFPQRLAELVRERGHGAAVSAQRLVRSGGGEQRLADLVRERGPRRAEQLEGQ